MREWPDHCSFTTIVSPAQTSFPYGFRLVPRDVIVGGMGATTGAVLGAVALKLLDELVTVAGPILSAAVAPQAAASLALISHGLVIIIFLIFEPRDCHHRWEMVKAYFRLWPFFP